MLRIYIFEYDICGESCQDISFCCSLKGLTCIFIQPPSTHPASLKARFVDEVKQRKGVGEDDKMTENTAVRNMYEQLKNIFCDAVSTMETKSWSTES